MKNIEVMAKSILVKKMQKKKHRYVQYVQYVLYDSWRKQCTCSVHTHAED